MALVVGSDTEEREEETVGVEGGCCGTCWEVAVAAEASLSSSCDGPGCDAGASGVSGC